MSLKHTTPVPNSFFDQLMAELSGVAIRVYLKICRNTYGWRDQNGNVKQRDWISHSQFSNVGVSSRSVTSAIEELLGMNLIVVTDQHGHTLEGAEKRKRAKRIYYGLTPHTNAKKDKNNANYNQRPTQNVPTTKEILYKKLSANPHNQTPDQIRIQQILEQEERKQFNKRDNWR